MDIQGALGNFSTLPPKDAARKFLDELGYRSDKSPRGLGSTPAEFEKLFIRNQTKSQFDKEKALFDEWKSVDLIFQYTDAELSQQPELLQDNDVSASILKSYIFISIELRGSDYARGKFSSIARQINRLFPQPVMVLIKHGDRLTIAIINRRYNKLDQSKDVLGKVTLIRDINIAQPHRGHVDILTSLALPNLKHPQKKPISDFDTLHAAWEQILNVELLNQRFYRDLSNWYFWALKQVEFPADLEEEDEKRKATGLIRLLTRLIFCWFLKEKDLVPDTLFNQADLSKLLKDFDPESEKSSTYYQAILQNLFFATLNQRMGKDGNGKPYRGFAADEGFLKNRQTYDINNLYRYEELFATPREEILKAFEDIPFLNGGLFECLDRADESTGKKMYIDGFSRNSKKRPHVPNRLFFDAGETADLSGAYGDTKRKAERVEGLVKILQRYKFTIVENTPIDQEIALDPELLGKVFENLLASYNEETKTTARKQTGSFYTPRPIVDYMVDESLKSHLKGALIKEAGMQPGDAEAGLDLLFTYTEKNHAFSPEEVKTLIGAIDSTKVLDPACGSGAFPMGALHKLVYILGKLDPNNARWKQAQLAKIDSAPMREELERAFSDNNDDYGRKLYLIENCLYGADIQPIAIQITKLRFFISLICDQKTNRNKKENHGIRPLPNLETKFVSADTLVGLKTSDSDMFIDSLVEPIEKEIDVAYHAYFATQRRDQKLILQRKIRGLREQLAKTVSASLGSADSTKAKHLAAWDPFDPQSTADFFDPHWMYGASLKQGFDIVIGNPPYISLENFPKSKRKDLWQTLFKTYAARGDIYCLFYERGLELLRDGGVLSFITSNKFQKAAYGLELRKLLASQQIVQLVDFCELPVFEAAADPIIVVLTKSPQDPELKFPVLIVKEEDEFPHLQQALLTRSRPYKASQLKASGWSLEGTIGLELVDKLRANGIPLVKHVNGRLHLGIRTGLNDAFVIDRDTRNSLIKEDPKSERLIKPWIRGRDIRRWTHSYEDLYVIVYPHGFNRELQKFPAILRHLKSYEKDLKQRGQCLQSRNGSEEGQHHWLELDNNPSREYLDSFETPKVVIADIGKCLKASWSDDGYFMGNTGYILPGADLYTLAVLLSSITDWYARMTFQPLGDPWQGGRMRFINRSLVTIPVPITTPENRQKVEALAAKAIKAAGSDDSSELDEIETALNALLYSAFKLTKNEIEIIEGSLSLMRKSATEGDEE